VSGALVDEQTLISTWFDRRRSGPAGRRDDIVVGIGDDAAVLRPEPGFDLVVATDTIVEGTHFPAAIAASAVGHRCLAVNLSDLAAMSAEPRWFSLALSLPRVEPAWVGDFAAGLFALADPFNVALVGGDTVRGPLGVTVTVHGRVRPGCAVLRSGAHPGDGVWVTGHPGDAVAGRLLLADPAAVLEPATPQAALRQRFLYPQPRVREGLALAGFATAMIDVSDGLDDDLGKLLAASSVGAELDAAALPLSAELLSVRAGEALECALTGGDDYELCFTARPSDDARLQELAAGWTTPLTRIGTIVPGSGAHWRLQGNLLVVPDTTFRHF
jgi:thiamine-monophosphate kinase